jgi:hypothetical protein
VNAPLVLRRTKDAPAIVSVPPRRVVTALGHHASRCGHGRFVWCWAEIWPATSNLIREQGYEGLTLRKLAQRMKFLPTLWLAVTDRGTNLHRIGRTQGSDRSCSSGPGFVSCQPFTYS